MAFSWLFVSILDSNFSASFDGLWRGDLLYIFQKNKMLKSKLEALSKKIVSLF
jgi:hypothetical protein